MIREADGIGARRSPGRRRVIRQVYRRGEGGADVDGVRRGARVVRRGEALTRAGLAHRAQSVHSARAVAVVSAGRAEIVRRRSEPFRHSSRGEPRLVAPHERGHAGHEGRRLRGPGEGRVALARAERR